MDGTQTINSVALFSLDLAYSLTERVGLLMSGSLLGGRAVGAGPRRIIACDRPELAPRARGGRPRGRTERLDPGPGGAAAVERRAQPGLKVPPVRTTRQRRSDRQDSGPSVMTVDQSIQPGDGGLGAVFGVQAIGSWNAFRPYLIGSYLINPRETNGVPTYRTRTLGSGHVGAGCVPSARRILLYAACATLVVAGSGRTVGGGSRARPHRW